MIQSRSLISEAEMKSPIMEAFRSLRTNLQFSKADGRIQKIMLTSASSGEGKSTTAANLAIALAQNNKKVLLIDADLRKPVQQGLFGLRKFGLTNILVEEKLVEEVIQPTKIANLSLLGSGPLPPNPAELLDSERMRNLLEYLETKFDFLILDVPPVIPVTDAVILAAKVDGIVLVINTRMTRPELAQQAKNQLLKANGQILGVVLNQVEVDRKHANYYYYNENQNKTVHH